MMVERNPEQLPNHYDLEGIKDPNLRKRLIGISDIIMGRKFPMKTQALKTLISSQMLPTLTHQPGEGYVRMIISERPIINVIRGGKKGVQNLHPEGHVFAVYSFLFVRDRMIEERNKNGIKKTPIRSAIIQETISRLGESHPISLELKLNADSQNPLSKAEDEDENEEEAEIKETLPTTFSELKKHQGLLETYGREEIEKLLNILTTEEKKQEVYAHLLDTVSMQKLKQFGVEIEPQVKAGIDFVGNVGARIKNIPKKDEDTLKEFTEKLKLVNWYFEKNEWITNLWMLIEVLNNIAEQEEKERVRVAAASYKEEAVY